MLERKPFQKFVCEQQSGGRKPTEKKEKKESFR